MSLLKTSFISKVTLLLVAAMLSMSAIAIDFNQTQRLADQGDANSQYNLGVMYEQGMSVTQDYAKARYWYEKAASKDNVKAQYNLGLMYWHGKGVRQNLAIAKELYGKVCDSGEQKGCDSYKILNSK